MVFTHNKPIPSFIIYHFFIINSTLSFSSSLKGAKSSIEMMPPITKDTILSIAVDFLISISKSPINSSVGCDKDYFKTAQPKIFNLLHNVLANPYHFPHNIIVTLF